MTYSHLHASSHLPENNNARRLSYIFGVTAEFMLVEVIGGFLPGPLALLADAGHMSTDTTTLPFALLTVQFSRWLLTIHHTFGWLRLATSTAFTNAIALVMITILIVWEAIECFRASRPVEGGMMIAITVAGLLADVLSFQLLHHGSEEKNPSVRVAALHMFGDLLGSAGAITAASIIIWTGRTPAGLTLSILVSLLVLRSAWRLLKDSVNELLEDALMSLDIAELKCRLCREIPEAHNIHHVHVWMVGEKPVMTLHIQVIPPHDHDVLLDQIQHYLVDRYQTERATIQMECQLYHGSDCHLNEGVPGHLHHHH